MDVAEIGWGGVDWIGLTQDRGKWRLLVNTVMNRTFGFHKMLVNYRVATQLVGCRAVLSSIQSVSQPVSQLVGHK
jgi:hypothetical protein